MLLVDPGLAWTRTHEQETGRVWSLTAVEQSLHRGPTALAPIPSACHCSGRVHAATLSRLRAAAAPPGAAAAPV